MKWNGGIYRLRGDKHGWKEEILLSRLKEPWGRGCQDLPRD